jgi:hypothetical protein
VTTTVVNKRTDEFDIYIGRPSKWGNPFVIGKDGNREEVITKFERYIWRSPLMADIRELRDKRLGCFCAPQPCHGDVLAQLADERFSDEWCDDIGREHNWGEWQINKHFSLREDRFCSRCGGMETQTMGAT